MYKKLVNGKKTCVNISEVDKIYIKRCGINMSEFLRQAIHLHKEGKFKFNYSYYDDK